MRRKRSLRKPERTAERLTGVGACDRECEHALVADVCLDDLGLAGSPVPLERDRVTACDPGQDATHVTADTTLPRRPRSRLRANASRADASGNIWTDGRRSSPASASLAIDRSWSRFGSTVKYSPPSGGGSPVRDRGIGTSYKIGGSQRYVPALRTAIRFAAGLIANATRRWERLDRCFAGASEARSCPTPTDPR